MYSLIRRLFKRKDELYDARALGEPDARVRAYINRITLVSVAVVIVGIWLDHSRCARCGGSPCNWFGRSGALMVLGGTYLAFRSGAVIITSIQYGTQHPILGTNPQPSRDYGRAAFVLLLIGTLIWGFGDLWQ